MKNNLTIPSIKSSLKHDIFKVIAVITMATQQIKTI